MSHFILDFQENNTYPYMEETNEGILKHIPRAKPNASILDVGCGRGTLGAALQALGYEVCGLESDEDIAKEAHKQLNQVFCVDLQDAAKVNQCLNGKQFDYIVFSDVLEHLFDPLLVLKTYQAYLKPYGQMMISIPNAVNWLNRLRFFFGIFSYEMTGVLDRTHIRFFTIRSAKQLVQASGLQIRTMDSTPFLIRAFLPFIKSCFGQKKTIINSPFYQFYSKFIYPVEYRLCRLVPRLFSFRIILITNVGERIHES